MTDISFEGIRQLLAPSGRLRVGVNFANPLFMARGVNGELAGVAVDVARELSTRLGIAMELVEYATPGDVVETANDNAWDVSMLAIEPARAEKVLFFPPMTEIEANYMVLNTSLLQEARQVDQPGVRVAVPARAGYELFLARTLQQAALVRTRDFDSSINTLESGNADVVAGLRPMLLDSMTKHPTTRLLDGRFMTVNHSLAIPHGRDTAIAWLTSFTRELCTSKFLHTSIKQHGILGLQALS